MSFTTRVIFDVFVCTDVVVVVVVVFIVDVVTVVGLFPFEGSASYRFVDDITGPVTADLNK